MSEEYDNDIYNNLNMIRECNFSTQMRAIVAAKCSNDDDSDDDFEKMICNNLLENSKKRSQKKNTSKLDQQKQSKKNVKKRRSSSWSEGSISPHLQLQQKDDVLCDGPISRRTRRSLEKSKATNCEDVQVVTSDEEIAQVSTTASRGRARRGRGRRPAKTNEIIITLDSDEDQKFPRRRNKKGKVKTKDLVNEQLLDISLDEENPELSVKVNWEGKLESFKLRKYQKFATLFKLLADREEKDIGSLVFNLNKRIITPDDTPDSIGYQIFHFISGRVMALNVNSPSHSVRDLKKQRIPNQISLKIQSDHFKRPLLVDIMKCDKFRVLYIKCAVELNVAIQNFKLSFDGEYLDLNGTPTDLDLEGGEAIDLRLTN